jgi:hypothetical protein
MVTTPQPANSPDTIPDRAPPAARGLSRRAFLKKGGTVGGLLIVTPTAVLSPDRAWGMEPAALTPDEMATLIRMARDVYPHDHVPDRFYAIAVKSHDTQAAEDADYRAMMQAGLADLDARAGGSYRALGWEDDRVAVLRDIADTPFFQGVRGGLVTGLYNQQEVWPLFGYEGESYSQGGYIDRGFDDIEWL